MHCLSNAFERRWTLVFLALYGLIMLPLPWYYNESYLPGPLGVPMFLWGWLAHGVTVLLAIIVFACQCLARPEYQNQTQDGGDA